MGWVMSPFKFLHWNLNALHLRIWPHLETGSSQEQLSLNDIMVGFNLIWPVSLWKGQMPIQGNAMWKWRQRSGWCFYKPRNNQRPVFKQRRWCCVHGGIGRESSIMSSFWKTKRLIPTSTAQIRPTESNTHKLGEKPETNCPSQSSEGTNSLILDFQPQELRQ